MGLVAIKINHITLFYKDTNINNPVSFFPQMSENLNDSVTRADLNQQLEIHAKTIELQILLSNQQEEILKNLEDCKADHVVQKKILYTLERRTWKQGWLFWGIIFSLISTAGAIITRM